MMRASPAKACIAGGKLLLALPAALFLSACGDPAPGAGMEQPLAEHPLPELVSAQEALASPNLPALDPVTMHEAEAEKVLGAGPRCVFSYTAVGGPIMAAGIGPDGSAIGVLKLKGRLVQLSAPDITSADQLAAGGNFSAGPIEFEVRPEEEGSGQRFAEGHFRVREELNVGYGGWYVCGSPD